MSLPSEAQTGDQTARVVRIVLTVGILVLGLALFSAFLTPLLWAGVLCYALNPLYAWLVRFT